MVHIKASGVLVFKHSHLLLRSKLCTIIYLHQKGLWGFSVVHLFVCRITQIVVDSLILELLGVAGGMLSPTALVIIVKTNCSVIRVRNLKYCTYLKFATCGNTNKIMNWGDICWMYSKIKGFWTEIFQV